MKSNMESGATIKIDICSKSKRTIAITHSLSVILYFFIFFFVKKNLWLDPVLRMTRWLGNTQGGKIIRDTYSKKIIISMIPYWLSWDLEGAKQLGIYVHAQTMRTHTHVRTSDRNQIYLDMNWARLCNWGRRRARDRPYMKKE